MDSFSDILAAVARVLAEAGFSVMTEPLADEGAGWVLAENDLFVLAVAAAGDLDDLRRVESLAARELVNRLRASETLGGKRWDAYLVLLSDQRMEDAAEARELVSIEYDTRGVRRLVASSVDGTDEDVRRVLRPFIPFPAPSGHGVVDAFSELQEHLVLNGLEREDARRFVGAFQSRGHLDDL